MRLPIALSPINILLVLLMLCSPLLGKWAKEQKAAKKRDQKIEKMIRLSSTKRVPESKPVERKKVLSTLKRLEQEEARKKEHAEKLKILTPQVSLNPESTMVSGEVLLTELKKEAKTPARPLQKKIDPITKKKIFYKQIKRFAKEGDLESAEEAFLSQLEEMDLSPLESLEKQASFKKHFEKLSRHLGSSDSSKSM